MDREVISQVGAGGLMDIAAVAILLALILVLIFWPPPPNKPLVVC